ncbi:MAG: hypothetical protein M3P49_11150 [Actinomycetota bacterium]|nr:hypothetical protein [Actinomycetota bacterium]
MRPPSSVSSMGSMPGATFGGALTLMAEHVASWAVAVGVLAASFGE